MFGVPHERLGEEVAVAVLPKAGMTIDADELRAFVAAHLAPFKVPSRVLVVDEPLPRNAAGKMLKRELRDGSPPRAEPTAQPANGSRSRGCQVAPSNTNRCASVTRVCSGRRGRTSSSISSIRSSPTLSAIVRWGMTSA